MKRFLTSYPAAAPCIEPKRKEKKQSDSKRVRTFQNEWLGDFSWLGFDAQKNEMFCKACIAKGQKAIKTSWNDDFRKETLTRHQKTKLHKDVVAEETRDARAATSMLDRTKTRIGRGILALQSHDRERMRALFNTAYGLAKNARPFTDYALVCQIQLKNKVVLGENYINDKKASEFCSYTASHIKTNTSEGVKASRFHVVLADSSTDTTIVEQEIVYVRYIDFGLPVTKFAGIVSLQHGNSDGVLDGIKEGMSEVGLTYSKDNPSILVSCNFDGASVMMGHKSGVAKKITDDFPWVIPIHCVAHKLELGILDAIRTIEYLASFEKTVKKLYNFYHYSPKRRREISDIANVLEQDLLPYGAVKNVRWVASKTRALLAIKNNLSITAAHLEHAYSAKPSDQRPKDLLDTILSFRFVKFLHLMLDILELSSRTSQLFQRKDLLLIVVPGLIEDLCLNLQTLMAIPGKNMDTFFKSLRPHGKFEVNGATVKLSGQRIAAERYSQDNDVINIAGGVAEYITDRFDNFNTPPLVCFNILNYKDWPYHMPADVLATFGNSDISELLQHFTQVFDDKTAEEVMLEWAALKNHLIKLRDSPMMDVYSALLRSPPEKMKHILILVELMFVISPSTAECERGFSAMNRIKTPLRNALSQKSLGDQMRIVIDGPELKDFDPDDIIDQWCLHTPGHRHMSGHKLPDKDKNTTSGSANTTAAASSSAHATNPTVSVSNSDTAAVTHL